MEQDKKQKMLIALLAVAGLGAGSFWYFSRETDTAQVAQGGPGTGRRERKGGEDAPKKEGRKEKEKKVAEAPAAATGRKEREPRAETEGPSGRKSRSGKSNEAVKKKKITPAA